MTAQSRIRALMLVVSTMFALNGIAVLAEEPPNPAAFQALLAKHNVEEIGELISACVSFETRKAKTLTSDDRKELLAVALEEKLSAADRESLMTLLAVTLRESNSRAQEAVDLTPQLETFQRKFADKNFWSLRCQSFSLDHPEKGAELEQAWFRRIAQVTGKERFGLLFVALAETRGVDHEQRFNLLREIYVDKNSDEETRLGITGIIFRTAMNGGMRLDDCIRYFHNLSQLPETTPAVNTMMFNHLLEYMEIARIFGHIDSASKK